MSKKVFTHKTKVPAGGSVETDIRVDEYGRWSAAIGLDSHEASEIGKLREWIDRTVARGREPHVEYTPFIEIFQLNHEEESWRNQRPEGSIMFRFDVVLLSKETYEETERSRGVDSVKHFRLRKSARVAKNLTVEEDDARTPRYDSDRRRSEDYTERDRQWSRIVPYTPQRYQTVCAIRDRINELRERLDELLVQANGADATLDRISVTGLRLLSLPEVKP